MQSEKRIYSTKYPELNIELVARFDRVITAHCKDPKNDMLDKVGYYRGIIVDGEPGTLFEEFFMTLEETNLWGYENGIIEKLEAEIRIYQRELARREQIEEEELKELAAQQQARLEEERRHDIKETPQTFAQTVIVKVEPVPQRSPPVVKLPFNGGRGHLYSQGGTWCKEQVLECEKKMNFGYCYVNLFPLTLQPQAELDLGAHPTIQRLYQYYLDKQHLLDKYTNFKSTLHWTVPESGRVHIEYRDVTINNTHRRTVGKFFNTYLGRDVTVGTDLNCALGNNIKHKNIGKKEKCSACSNGITQMKAQHTEQCLHCKKFVRNLALHNCDYNFAQHERVAWPGDALHRYNVVKKLFELGYPTSSTSTVLNSFLSCEAQVTYLRDSGHYKAVFSSFSDHKVSTYFEALYYEDELFRETYQRQVLDNIQPYAG